MQNNKIAIGFVDIEGTEICDGDKIINVLKSSSYTYNVRFYKGNWWLFDKDYRGEDIPYMILLPQYETNIIAQHRVVK